jgi:hypothetical protein
MSAVGARHDSYRCLEPDRIGVNSIIESIAGGFHDAIVRGRPCESGTDGANRGRRGHPLGTLAIDEACESLGNSRLAATPTENARRCKRERTLRARFQFSAEMVTASFSLQIATI